MKKKRYGGGKGTQASPCNHGEHGAAMAFSFGDPEPILAGQLYEGLGSALMDNGRYYQTPVPLTGMARLLRANAFHGPILEFKMNQVMRGFAGSTVVNRNTMRCMAMDFLVFANAYAQVLRNGFGEVVALRHLPAINMRRHKEANRCCQLTEKGEIIDFMPGEVLHLKNYDVTQEIYGMPSYLGAIQSMLLNEDATLFRRRYYKNGAHMGYIFYSSSAGLSMNDQAAIKKAVHGSKGVGNFKNMFLHIPNGREKDVQILPVGDFSTRDELTQIKNISRDDIIAAHRIPPAMANIIPTAAGGLGDITKVDSVYQKNEIDPIRDYLLEINDFLPKGKGISFKPDTLPGGPGGAGGKPKE